MRLPSYNPITLKFGPIPGYSLNGGFHQGVDFSPSPDPTIYAVESGQVALVPNNGNDGNGIYMNVENRRWGYCHTSKYLVQNGEWVNEGQPLAIMGYSGYVEPPGPAGTHCHLALKVNGVFTDPLSVIPQKEEIPLTDENFIRAFWLDLFGIEPTADQLKQYVGRPWQVVYSELRNSDAHKQRVTTQAKIEEDNNIRAMQVTNLLNEVAILTKNDKALEKINQIKAIVNE